MAAEGDHVDFMFHGPSPTWPLNPLLKGPTKFNSKIWNKMVTVNNTVSKLNKNFLWKFRYWNEWKYIATSGCSENGVGRVLAINFCIEIFGIFTDLLRSTVY